MLKIDGDKTIIGNFTIQEVDGTLVIHSNLDKKPNPIFLRANGDNSVEVHSIGVAFIPDRDEEFVGFEMVPCDIY